MLKRASFVMALVITGTMLLPLCAHEDGDDLYDDDHFYPRGSVSITPEQAVAEAQRVVPGKVVLNVKLDDEHGAWVYEVRFTDGTEVKVDATTGVVMYVEPSYHSSDDHGVPGGSVTITPNQAVAEAQKVVPGKTVRKVELDNERGTWVYEVHFTDGTEVKVDATTGVVIQVKPPRGSSGSNTGTSGGKPGGKSRGQNNGGRSKGRRR